MFLLCLLDRIFWSTIFYLGLAGVSYTNGESIPASLRYGFLGARAPSVRDLTPWNIGLVFREAYFFLTNQHHEHWRRCFKLHRPEPRHTCETTVFGERAVHTIDPENIKAILATQFNDYGKGPQFRQDWEEFLGLSIFTTDGDLWHNSRALLRPQFVKERVSDLQLLESHIRNLLPLLRGSESNGSVRIDTLFLRYTLDTATEFLLGQSTDSLHGGDSGFAAAFNKIQYYQALKSCMGSFTLLATGRDFRKQLGVANEFINGIIDRALELPLDELDKSADGKQSYTFLHAIVRQTRDRKILRDNLIAVLLAGRDTTALTLSWLFYQLSLNPRVVDNLREEIGSTLPGGALPTYAHLKAMTYLQNTLKEILRLYPVVPYNVRVALKDTTVPRGGGTDGDKPVGLTKGTPVFYSTLVMQRRADIYPPPSPDFPDCNEFCPERWIGWNPKSWTYIPFNGGPRICIGQQFALTEMAYTVVRILQTFDKIEFRMDKHPSSRSDIVLQPYPGVTVALFENGTKAE